MKKKWFNYKHKIWLQILNWIYKIKLPASSPRNPDKVLLVLWAKPLNSLLIVDIIDDAVGDLSEDSDSCWNVINKMGIGKMQQV